MSEIPKLTDLHLQKRLSGIHEEIRWIKSIIWIETVFIDEDNIAAKTIACNK